MKSNLNLKGSQCHNEGSNKLLNQSLQGGSKKISYMSSNRPSGNCCKVPNENLIGHVLGEQNGRSTVDELVGSLQTFEMTLRSPMKSKGIALNAIKEESLGSECEGDEKISDGEVARFVRKFKKYMFKKYKKKSKEDDKKMEKFNGKIKCK